LLASRRKFLIEKRWAFAAVIIGFIVGFSSAVACVYFQLIIFGFNIMYILSPLSAGVVETVIARRKYGRSTGAISALLIFIVINIYGWFFPKTPVTLSLITLIAIGLTIDAAFPTFTRYILFVVVMGSFIKFINFLVNLPSILLGNPPVVEGEKDLTESSSSDFFSDDLIMPVVSIPHMDGGVIKKFVGLVVGEAVLEEKNSEGRRFSNLLKTLQPKKLDDMNLDEARKLAISRMLKNAKSIGGNMVVEVLINYVSVGGLQGNAFIVSAYGTAVLYE
jgi:uncharacterized protein YbjQ (UPF0145 family)